MLWIYQAMDHEEILGASYRSDASTMGRGTNDGSNNKRLDGGWISEELKDRWMDQGALDGATDGACDGVLSNRRSDGSVSK